MSGVRHVASSVTEATLRHSLSDGPAAASLGAVRPAVWLRRLSVANFRCYRAAALELDGRPVVLAGPNGAGKTNMLEAISLLTPGRGLRGARLEEMDRRVPGAPEAPGNDGTPSAPWAVAAAVATPDGPREVGTGRDPAPEARERRENKPEARERRVIKIDGAFARRQQALGEILAVTWLTPRMDGLFRDGPGARRRFLDRLVHGLDPAHAGRVSAYERAMRERARLLRAGRADDAWLGALEEGMARRGIAIAAARRDLVTRLGALSARRVGPFPVAELTLSGDVARWLDEGPALAAEDRLRHALAAARATDAETGGAAAGPHRADLVVRHAARAMPAAACSTGEQKALLVSMVLAHGRLLDLHRGAPPILLLDEVAAHLDAARRDALYGELVALGTQAWLTGTDAGVFAPLGAGAQFFHVADATVRPAGAGN